MSHTAIATVPAPIGAQRSLGEARWLELVPDPVLAHLHMPPGASPRPDSGVLICPPFGWDETCSYRARRTWADALAHAGHAVARFDLPGSGDSGGSPLDPERVRAWRQAVAGVAAWLSELTSGGRITAIGIGLGGILAGLALADGAPIDDLVLWAVPDAGRRLVREIRAQGSVVAGRNPDDQRASVDGALESVGFVLTAETVADLERVRLSELAWPSADGRRALLLSRGSLGVDERLAGSLRHAGMDVTVADGPGYGELMLPPQESRTPLVVIEATVEWLGSAPRRSAVAPRADLAAPRASDAVQLGASVRETPLTFELGSGRLMGVLAEPAAGERADVCAVLLNSGVIRHVGPSRLWVEIARRWAARGVAVLRVDLEAIGDSDGDGSRYHGTNDPFFTDDMFAQVRAVLDALTGRDLPDRFALAGLCAGADWALHVALAEPRVAATMMVNPAAIFWEQSMLASNEVRKVLTSLRGRAWRRMLRRDLRMSEVREVLVNLSPVRVLAGARSDTNERVDDLLDRLRTQETEVLFLVGQMESIEAQFVAHGRLERLERWPNVRWERLPTRDHMFRAVWLQREVEASFDAALDRVLAAPSR